MSIEENKAIIQKYFKEMNDAKGNLVKIFAVMDKYLDPKFVEHLETGDVNVDQSKQLGTAIYEAFPDSNSTYEDTVAEGDKVVTRITIRGTHKGECMGVAPTGKKVSYAGITIFRIAEGKIAEAWGVHDTFGLMQQLGAIPSR